jgi:tetratricopeptide (TPR) repeat protein
MSLSAKILPFPSRRVSAWLSPGEADFAARDFLAIPIDRRSDADRERYLGSPDILLAICSHLRLRRDLAPAVVETEALDAYRWISRPTCDLGLFDERDYFLGEVSLLAAAASRQLGKREEAFRWLDRAEAGFRHTMNPAPSMANVAYVRLALRYEMGRYVDVLELSPSLEAGFSRLRMHLEGAKCRLLRAMTLKQTGDHKSAIELLGEIRSEPAFSADPFLGARILAELGDSQQLEGRLDLAMTAFQEALSLLQGREVSLAKADLKLYVGGVHKALGALSDATEAFRDAQRDYQALGMRALVAYTHLVIAETLLEMRREREAEWEILAALPAIDEMKMVPEGLAAVALLRESVRQRKPDTSALQKLRAQLQGNN